MQLKREAKLLTVIGLNTKQADCRIISPETAGHDWKFEFVFIAINKFNKELNNLRTIFHFRKFGFCCISFTKQCHSVFHLARVC